jgi:hypothetical protein
METIEKAYYIRSVLANPELVETITGIGELPGLPDFTLRSSVCLPTLIRRLRR